MEISKSQILKNAIDEVQERTKLTKIEIAKLLLNDYEAPEKEKTADQLFGEFMRPPKEEE